MNRRGWCWSHRQAVATSLRSDVRQVLQNRKDLKHSAVISGTEVYLSCYGVADVEDGKDVMEGVSDGTTTVNEGVNVKLGVVDGV